MESETKRPGAPSGVGAILRDLYGMPERPTIDREDARSRVREKAEALGCERLDLSLDPVRRGALVDMSGARVPFPGGKAYDRCFVALIDPDVDAGWGHAAFWAFVPAVGDGDVVVQTTQFPEHGSSPVRFSRMPLP
jgi:hypothetical protein